jgi:S-adenosyl methyltransferase
VDRPAWVPADIDITRPSPARLYDYFLGGSHNFAVDRNLADRAIAASPDIPYAARSNRAFLRRAVRFMTSNGVDQFLDIGSGIPTEGPTHEIATSGRPGARVVYVDRDPVAVAHSRALLTDDARDTVLQADLRDPQAVLAADEVRTAIDFDRPVGLLLLAVLHFVSDEEDPAAIVATLRKALAPGSYLAISHVSTALRLDQDKLRRDAGLSAPLSYVRDPAEIGRFFGDWELVEPGLVPIALWRPDGVPGPEAARMPGVGGVARHPG